MVVVPDWRFTTQPRVQANAAESSSTSTLHQRQSIINLPSTHVFHAWVYKRTRRYGHNLSRYCILLQSPESNFDHFERKAGRIPLPTSDEHQFWTHLALLRHGQTSYFELQVQHLGLRLSSQSIEARAAVNMATSQPGQLKRVLSLGKQ